jgi:hypothetical protein
MAPRTFLIRIFVKTGEQRKKNEYDRIAYAKRGQSKRNCVFDTLIRRNREYTYINHKNIIKPRFVAK